MKVGPTARQFGVTTETIRKDLIYLEERGLARKSHGGATSVGELIERPATVKVAENPEAKAEIALAARELIPEGAVLLLDAGSTTVALARVIASMHGVSVFTNSIPVMALLGPTDNCVFCFGGQLRGSSMAIAGGWAVSALRSIHIDLAFLGSDGFGGLAGPSSASYEETEFKAEVIRASDRAVVLADHSKFSQPGLFQFCRWEDVYALVTDQRAPESDVRAIGKRTKVVTAASSAPGLRQ